MTQNLAQPLPLDEELAEHTLAHFQHEEMLIKSCAYPKYERHKQTHDGLKTKIVDLLQKFSAEETLVVATRNHNRLGPQSSRFWDQINCNYPVV
jgi:hemerythrin